MKTTCKKCGSIYYSSLPFEDSECETCPTCEEIAKKMKEIMNR